MEPTNYPTKVPVTPSGNTRPKSVKFPSASPTTTPNTTISMDTLMTMEMDCSGDLNALADLLGKSLFETMSTDMTSGQQMQDVNVYELCGQSMSGTSRLLQTTQSAVRLKITVQSQCADCGDDVFNNVESTLQSVVSSGALAQSISTNSGGTITVVISDNIVSTYEVITSNPTSSPSTMAPVSLAPSQAPTAGTKSVKSSKEGKVVTKAGKDKKKQ